MEGMTDLHSHVLPGVDDGAGSVAAALQMLQRGVVEGIRAVVLTPHLRAEHGPEQVRLHERRFAELQAEVERRAIPIEMHLGAEVTFRYRMEDVPTWGSVCLGSSRYVLVDLSPGPLPLGLEEGFFRLRAAGFRPVLAHPERQRALAARPEVLSRLRHQGVLVQVDAGSLDGSFGRRARRAAESLVEGDWVDLVASDAHDTERRPLSLLEAVRRLDTLGEPGSAHRLLVENPARLLQDLEVEPRAGRRAQQRSRHALRRLLACVGRR